MSLTIHQIITDAKRLASCLKDKDALANSLLLDAHAVTTNIHAMKQYQEEVEVLNEVADQKPHSQLIANIQKENRHLREIQQENRELRAALEDYQTTLEHVMTKYREHTTEEVYKTKIDFKAVQDKIYNDIVTQQAEKIQEMAAVMEKAALMDEDKSVYNEEMIAMLRAENTGLKEMLGIALKSGSFVGDMEDKIVQTEPDSLPTH